MEGLRSQRKKRNATLKVVAMETGISIQVLSTYERGTREPSVSTLKKLAKYFDCSIDELVGFDGK